MHPSLWAAVESIAPMIDCVPQTSLEWLEREEIDSGRRDGPELPPLLSSMQRAESVQWVGRGSIFGRKQRPQRS